MHTCGQMCIGASGCVCIDQQVLTPGHTSRSTHDVVGVFSAVQGFKLGLCHHPPVGLPYSLLCLSNNCCMADTFKTVLARFDKLYKRK